MTAHRLLFALPSFVKFHSLIFFGMFCCKAISSIGFSSFLHASFTASYFCNTSSMYSSTTRSLIAMSSRAVASEIFTMAGTLTILDIVARWFAASLACQCMPGEDPGFPIGGGTNPPGGCQHIILPNFVKNCMKLRKFWGIGGCPG